MYAYGIDKQGGFFMISHKQRAATYAYPSSPLADLAKQDIHEAFRRSTLILDDDIRACPKHLIENNYVYMCEKHDSQPQQPQMPPSQVQ